MQVHSANVYEAPHSEQVLGSETWQGGGDVSALRAYQAYHPGARIYNVTHRGRLFWMTSKQFAILRTAQKYDKRGKRTTLDEIAAETGASRATVSRFLRRLDFWRFINLASLVGRGGGTYIFTRRNPFADSVAWDAGAKITQNARARARDILAMLVRRRQLMNVEPLLRAYRIPRMPWYKTGVQRSLRLGNTGATFPGSHKGFAKGGAR